MLIETAIAGGAVWGYKKLKQKGMAQLFEKYSLLLGKHGFDLGSLQFIHGYRARTTKGNISDSGSNSADMLIGRGVVDGEVVGVLIELDTENGEMSHSRIPAWLVDGHKHAFKLAKEEGVTLLEAFFGLYYAAQKATA